MSIREGDKGAGGYSQKQVLACSWRKIVNRWFFSRFLDPWILFCSHVIQRVILWGQRLIPGFCLQILKLAPKWAEDYVHPHDHRASRWVLVLLSYSSQWHRHNATPVTGHEELEWTCIKGSSDWAAGKGPSPRGWSGTGTGSWGKWSQHQASRTLWTMLSASFSFRWCCEEQGAGLGDAYGSLPTWYSVIPESLGLCGKWSEGGERCFLLRCAFQQRHGISPAERGHLEMHCPK